MAENLREWFKALYETLARIGAPGPARWAAFIALFRIGITGG